VPNPSWSSSRFALTLDGVDCGFVRSVEGGSAVADVVAERGPDYFDRKRLGPLHFEEFVLQVDLSLPPALSAWVAGTLTGKAPRCDGSVIEIGPRDEVRSQRDFFGALLTQVTIPALDASSKEPGHLTLAFAPEQARSVTPTVQPGAPGPGRIGWQPRNFRLDIDGLDCSHVSSIGALSIRNVLQSGVGEQRDPAMTATRLVFPDLTVTGPAAPSWLDWADDFLIKGNHGSANERQGSLTFLSADLRQVLGVLHLTGLGIFRLDRASGNARDGHDTRLTAGLYCQRMELSGRA
jgi:hypothetical protein